MHHRQRPALPLDRESGAFANAAESVIVADEQCDPCGPWPRPCVERRQQTASQGTEPTRAPAHGVCAPVDEAVKVPGSFNEDLGKTPADELVIPGR
jgi:hypothetical protein